VASLPRALLASALSSDPRASLESQPLPWLQVKSMKWILFVDETSGGSLTHDGNNSLGDFATDTRPIDK
jgi:hypothetical protein